MTPFELEVTLTWRQAVAAERAFPRLGRDLLRFAGGAVLLAAVGLLLPVAVFGTARPLGPLVAAAVLVALRDPGRALASGSWNPGTP